MKISDISNLENYELLNNIFEDTEITDAYTSDLLSDVMANAPDESVFITIQAHKNTIAVSSLAGIMAIIICNNRTIPKDMIEAADNEKIVLFRTPDTQFQASYKIGRLLDENQM